MSSFLGLSTKNSGRYSSHCFGKDANLQKMAKMTKANMWNWTSWVDLTNNFMCFIQLKFHESAINFYQLRHKRLLLIWSRTHSVPGHLVPHNWSPRTNSPSSIGPHGQMVPKTIGPPGQLVPKHLVPMDKWSPRQLVPLDNWSPNIWSPWTNVP